MALNPDSASASNIAETATAVVVILAVVLRQLNTRDVSQSQAKDAATNAHIQSLLKVIGDLRQDLAVLRLAHDTLIEKSGEQGGQCKLLTAQQTSMNDAMEKLRIQHDALQADLQMTREDAKVKGVQIEEQVLTIQHRETLLDSHNVPWRN